MNFLNKYAKFNRDYSLALFMLPAALILIVFGCISIGPVAKRLNYPQTEAIVTKAELYEEAYYDSNDTHHDATYTIFVKYTLDGQEYEEEYGVFPKMNEGDKVTINYNPNDHRDIGQPHSMLLPYGIIAAGIVALAVGVVCVIRTRNKNKALKQQEEEWKNG